MDLGIRGKKALVNGGSAGLGKGSAKALARNKARITFPWQMVIIARVCMNLPNFIVDRINKPWGVPRLENSRPAREQR